MIRQPQKAEVHIFSETCLRREHRGGQVGKRILYNVLSGDFFEIDDIVSEVLELCDGRTSGAIIKELSTKYPKNSLISSLDELEACGILMENAPSPMAFHPPERLEIIHLAFHVTHDCNLNCKYCYLVQAGIKNRASFYMDVETANRAIDLLIKESGKLDTLYVSFYGGESLLNFSLLYNIIEYGKRKAAEKDKRILFDLTTNGTLLNKRILRYLGSEVDITISLDGCAMTHNAMRPIDTKDPKVPLCGIPLRGNSDGVAVYPDKVGGLLRSSYGIILDNIESLNLAEYSNIHLRATVTKNDTNLCGIVEHLVSLGVASSIQLAFAALPYESPYSIKEEDIPLIKAEKRKLSLYWLEYIKSDAPIWLSPLEDNMAKLLKRQVSFYHCGAGTRYLVVTPDGGLFICPGLITSDEYKLGDVYTGIDRKKQAQWILNYHVDKLEHCSSCWARYLCGGGCRLDSVITNKEPTKPNPISCELIKADYEQAMAMLIAVSEIDENIFKKRYAVNGFR